MRNRAVVGGAMVLFCATVLSGCSAPTQKHSATPAASSTPSAAPVFASDEEALAAAEKAYGDYLAVFDSVTQAGGVDSQPMAAVAAETALVDAQSDADEFRQLGYRTTGSTAVTKFELEKVERTVPVRVTVYVCEDVSAVDVLNSEGASQVSSDHQTRQAFEVGLEENQKGSLKVTDRSVWQGAGVCD